MKKLGKLYEQLKGRSLEDEFLTACAQNDLDKVKLCVKLGVDIHTGKGAALWYATKNGNMELIEYLMDKGCKVHPTTIRIAIEKDRLDILKYFRSRKVNLRQQHDITLRHAACVGNLRIVRYAVEELKADIHAMDDYALRWSSRRFPVIAMYLIEHGADVCVKRSEPLRRAITFANRIPDAVSFVQYLLDKGARAFDVSRKELDQCFNSCVLAIVYEARCQSQRGW